MHIILYTSKLCPRCYLARKHLFNIISSSNEISCEEVDVVASPKRAWKDGVRSVPLIRVGRETLSGILLNESKINNFLDNIKQKKDL